MSDATSWLMCGNVKSKNHVRTCSVFAKCKTPQLYKVSHQKIDMKVMYISRSTSSKQIQSNVYCDTSKCAHKFIFSMKLKSFVFVFIFYLIFYEIIFVGSGVSPI